MTLDLNTLHFASATSRCAYVVVFLVMAVSQHRQAYLWHWMGAMGSSMAGSLIMMSVSPDTLPPIPVTMVAYWLYSASLVLSWTGLRSFFGRRVDVGIGIALIALPGILYPVLLGMGLSVRLALAAIFACCLLVAVLVTYETLRVPVGATRLWSQSIETMAFGFYAAVFLLSIGVLLGTDWPIASAESARNSMILDQVTGVFVYFGYVAMTAERANRTLVRLAETDPLTGLANRRGLQAMLQRRAQRPGGGRSASTRQAASSSSTSTTSRPSTTDTGTRAGTTSSPPSRHGCAPLSGRRTCSPAGAARSSSWCSRQAIRWTSSPLPNG